MKLYFKYLTFYVVFLSSVIVYGFSDYGLSLSSIISKEFNYKYMKYII